MANDLFDGDPVDTDTESVDILEDQENVPYLERLVGEGRKFPTLEDLARGKFESDMHIHRIEQENKRLRELTAQQKTVDELMDLIRQEQNAPSNPVTNQNEPASESRVAGTTPEEIQALVNKTLEKKQLETERAHNVQKVETELRKLWGDNYSSKLKSKVRELGVSEDFMANMAETHPQAFLKLVSDGQSNSIDTNQTTPPVNRMVPSALQNNPNQLAQYYTDMRRKDPKKYWSPAVQDEIVKLHASGKLKFQ
jgi:hypothetical protein